MDHGIHRLPGPHLSCIEMFWWNVRWRRSKTVPRGQMLLNLWSILSFLISIWTWHWVPAVLLLHRSSSVNQCNMSPRYSILPWGHFPKDPCGRQLAAFWSRVLWWYWKDEHSCRNYMLNCVIAIHFPPPALPRFVCKCCLAGQFAWSNSQPEKFLAKCVPNGLFWLMGFLWNLIFRQM